MKKPTSWSTRISDISPGSEEHNSLLIIWICPDHLHSYDIISQPQLVEIIERAYDNTICASHRELALLFMVLAIGSLHNLEALPNDPMSQELCDRAREALSPGDFLAVTTLGDLRTLVRDRDKPQGIC